jgi:hypothetical protein
MTKLVQLGVLVLTKEADCGKRRPREYRIDLARLDEIGGCGGMPDTGAPDAPVSDGHPTGAGQSPDGCPAGTLPVSHSHPEPINEPTNEASKDSIKESRAAARRARAGDALSANDLQAFESFWSEYPRKVSKGSARRAFKVALAKASTGDLVIGARRYAEIVHAEGREERFIKHAATWLTAEGWLDEAAPSTPRGLDPDPFSAAPRGTRHQRGGIAAALAEIAMRDPFA